MVALAANPELGEASRVAIPDGVFEDLFPVGKRQLACDDCSAGLIAFLANAVESDIPFGRFVQTPTQRCVAAFVLVLGPITSGNSLAKMLR